MYLAALVQNRKLGAVVVGMAILTRNIGYKSKLIDCKSYWPVLIGSTRYGAE